MSYLGSKGGAGVFQTIIGNMPVHSCYGEMFAGTGKIFREKLPATARNVICDADRGTLEEYFSAAAQMSMLISIPGLSVICGHALNVIPALDFPPDGLIYCDPPYLRSTRTSRHRYLHEFESPEEHDALLTLLQGVPWKVMLSGYPSKLYSQRLRNWRCVSYRTRTRGRTVTECLWCNFGEPVELHDWRYAGRNYRERLTLKRRVSRLTAKLEALAPRHKGFVLDAIRQRYFGRYSPAGHAGNDAAAGNVGNGAAR